ncbi:cation:proton antiporter [Lactobacillus sp. ESL0684]|uniref:cation:proton antiporter n=1 Tax=Lactobacillus sp. ESL0684 TaxID=2983213 RepID=UPI0023F6AC14|nr:cation:proton antiporter [Lactobacillus sp. ESL0684]WEV43634.1 cation:proton antiporter [Lactobacillus sp. ESL0684]
MYFLGELILILTSSVLLGQIFTRLNLPAVIGQLIAGILLGPALLNCVKPGALINLFSEFGVILLMFLAGLESDLALLKKYFKLSFTVASVGVILPVVFMGAASLLFGMKIIEALFIGIVFAATSVSISVVVLQEKGQLHTPAGTTILGAAVVDDILAVVILSLFTTFSHTNGNSGPTNNLGINLLLEASFFGFLWLIYRLTPHIMQVADRLNIAHANKIVALILVLSMAWLAEYVGLSDLIGAFFGGLALRQTTQYKELDTAISTIGYTVFIPVFFAKIGLEITFTSFLSDLGFIAVMTVLAIISKFWAGKYSCQLFGFDKTAANIVGAGMISRGEVALIVAQIGRKNQLFPQDIYSSLIFVIIITTVLSPFILNYFIKDNNDVRYSNKNGNEL